MTREFIHRILTKLNDAKIEYVVTGSVSKFLRGISVATMDLDIVVETTLENLNKIDHLSTTTKEGDISEKLKNGQIIRVIEFPFRYDLLPRLDGLTNREIFLNKAEVEFRNLMIPIISESDLAKNYQSFKNNE